MSDYLSGWQDGISHLSKLIQKDVDNPDAHGALCLDCRIDAARFEGIRRSVEGIGFPTASPDITAVSNVVELLAETAMKPDALEQVDILRIARALTHDTPDMATDVIVVMALWLVKRLSNEPGAAAPTPDVDCHATHAADANYNRSGFHIDYP